MAPTTRQQLLIAQHAERMLIFPKRGIRLTAALDVRAFAYIVTRSPEVAFIVEELYICLRMQLPTTCIHASLASAMHITELTLLLPPSTSELLLNHVVFPNLVVFKTTLPHGHITGFLPSQPSLRHLYFGICGRKGRGPCPLAPLDLAKICDMICPANCLTAVLHPGVEKLRSEMFASTPTLTTILRNLPHTLPILSILTLNLQGVNPRILGAIASIAPRLTHLKLIEKSAKSVNGRRPTDVWTRGAVIPASLRRLRELQELVIKTSSRFVRITGSLDQELEMITHLTSYRPGGDIVRTHPTLQYISVWYRAQESTHGVISCWSRAQGPWTRMRCVIHPDKHSEL